MSCSLWACVCVCVWVGVCGWVGVLCVFECVWVCVCLYLCVCSLGFVQQATLLARAGAMQTTMVLCRWCYAGNNGAKQMVSYR